MSILLSLASALTYGFADFSGGMASRRTDPIAVTASAQFVGLLVVPLALLGLPAAFSPEGLAAGAFAGLFGGLGLALYFTALRDGPMGVVSPLSAVAAAGVPLTAGIIGGERPALLATLGILVALPAIWLAARAPGGPDTIDGFPAVGARPWSRLPPGVLLGVAAGLAFGLFFLLLDLAPNDSGAWPLLGSKAGSLALVLVLAAARRRSPVAGRQAARLVVISGVLDMTANLLFLLATRGGLLSLVSVITSQYPVVVVVLSLAVLREALAISQRVGVVLALASVALISLGG